jgi:hypothetical protein
MLAAALETRRYAAYLGATTEWTKWEGITYDPKRRRLYTAMTEMMDVSAADHTIDRSRRNDQRRRSETDK